MNNDQKWYILQSKLKRRRASELLSALDELGIQSVLIKGAAVARFYPEGVFRPQFDIDLAVNPEDHDRVASMFRNEELGPQDADLHKGLRHFDRRDWKEIYERTKIVEINGTPLRMLCEEDQLRVTCIHWLNDGGERQDRLADIYYLVKNRPLDFDWDYALDADGEVRRGWIISSIGLAHKYLDLDISTLPFAEEAKILPVWLINGLEKRWEDEVKFAPLDLYLKEPVNFLKQLKRRIPPNPIMATVMTEGEFDSGGRLKYQVRYFVQRAYPSFRRSCTTLVNVVKPRNE